MEAGNVMYLRQSFLKSRQQPTPDQRLPSTLPLPGPAHTPPPLRPLQLVWGFLTLSVHATSWLKWHENTMNIRKSLPMKLTTPPTWERPMRLAAGAGRAVLPQRPQVLLPLLKDSLALRH